MHLAIILQYNGLATVSVKGLVTTMEIYKGISYKSFSVASLGKLNKSTAGAISH